MHPTGPVARRSPLVARHRPACLPLNARVGRLCEPADTASRQADPGLASTVFNQAAFLASDLARVPLPVMSAIRGLEPIVNLARLHIRAGHRQRSHQVLLDLYSAVTNATETVLDSITVLPGLTETDQQRAEVRAWVARRIVTLRNVGTGRCLAADDTSIVTRSCDGDDWKQQWYTTAYRDGHLVSDVTAPVEAVEEVRPVESATDLLDDQSGYRPPV
ncbi:hypothetical protein [Kitasatospora sp. NPDC056184]|uniref:hypothetical protein n=1 Tax=Kitasatospora sp. NPDC056184 TaxID=3345738 RepID=UPI0035D7D254